jgi:uncharacterized membrane protein
MEDYYMSIRTKCIKLLLSLVIGIIYVSSSLSAPVTDSVKLYTPYTKISVPPGESIDYSIDIINKSTSIRNADISIEGLPKGWIPDLKAGGWNIKQLSVLPGETKTMLLKIEVPLNVNKGTYRFRVLAGGFDSLPLVVIISEQGSFKTEFSSDQPNMEGNSNSTFTFNTNLKNRTAEKQMYALMANAPRGWNVTFKSNYQQVTSVIAEPNNTMPLTIEIKPPENSEAGKYKIPVSASTYSTSANLELEVVIKGTYSMLLSTPTGLVSGTITAGKQKQVELVIHNTGSAELKDINLVSTSSPLRWEVTFNPNIIKSITPGNSAIVNALIKADKKAIPGDYVTNIESRTPETTSRLTFRMSVETPLLLGWIGIIIIIIALGTVYYLFRKYGRR